MKQRILLEWSLLQRERISFSPAKTNLTELVSETAASQRETAQMKNIDLQLQLETVEYDCDKNMIRTSLRNLISNAIKFTPKGGKINIELKESSDNIDINIADSGIGIDCKEFVELNGGTLNVESEVNKGSTFKITLPNQRS